MADRELNLIATVQTMDAAKSVKELREQIKTLSDCLVQADKDTEGYNEASQALYEKTQKLANVQKIAKNGLIEYGDSLNAMRAHLRSMTKEYDNLSKAQRDSDFGQQKQQDIANLTLEIKELEYETERYQRNVGNYQGAIASLTREYSNQRQELAAMKSAMDNLDPSSEEYAKAFQRAAEITHNLQERQENLKYASADLGDQLSNMRGIAANMAAGFSAAQAAIGLFGGESEGLQKAMLKTQQAMALVQGLEGLDGFIKRTEGLSKAIKVWTTEQTKSTAATTADAAATAADTTAKAGQTVATEGATVAQKGLNAAMKANPIGLIITLVTAAITVFSLFKDKIIDLVGGSERVNAVWDRMKVILSGVGNVIKNQLLGPMSALIHIVKGEFGKAAEDIKKSWDIVGSYQEGAQKQMTKQAEAQAKKRIAANDKEMSNYIKDMEAKKGSDWKYTDEGKKKYDEYYNNKLKMYDKDSDEYRQAQRDQWSYQRDFENRKTKTAASGAASRKKIAEDEAKKIRENYEKLVVNYLKTDMDKLLEKLQERIDAWNAQNPDDKVLEIGYALKYSKGGGFSREEFEKAINEEIDTFQLEDTISRFNTRLNSARNLAMAGVANTEYTELVAGLIVPDDAVKAAEDKFNILSGVIDKQVGVLMPKVQRYLEEYGEDSDIYKKTVAEAYSLVKEKVDLGMERIKAISDAWKTYYENQKTQREFDTENQVRKFEEDYQLMESEYKAYWAVSNNTIELLKKRRETENNIFESRKEQMEADIELYKAMSADEKLTATERANAKAELAQTEMDLESLVTQHTIEENKKRIESTKEWINAVGDAVGGVGDILGTIGETWEANVETQIEAQDMSEEEAEEYRNSEYEKMKGLKKAEALINSFSAAISAYNSLASIPYVGPALGAAAAAAALALGMAQVRQIEATKYGKNGSSGGSSAKASPTLEPYVPDYVQNTTGESDVHNLRNAMADQPIYVRVTDIDNAQKGKQVKTDESTF